MNIDVRLFAPPHRVVDLYDIEVIGYGRAGAKLKHITIKVIDCASPDCATLLSSKLPFSKRYEFAATRIHSLHKRTPVIHKSEISLKNATLILLAQDFGLFQNYREIMRHINYSIIDLKGTAFGEPMVIPRGNAFPVSHKGQENASVPLSIPQSFCKKLGLPETLPVSDIFSGKCNEMQQQMTISNEPTYSLAELGGQQDAVVPLNAGSGDCLVLVNRNSFLRFCQFHNIDESGVRHVAIKFMTRKADFQRELSFRHSIKRAESWKPVIPILDHYDATLGLINPISEKSVAMTSALRSAQRVGDEKKNDTDLKSSVSALPQCHDESQAVLSIRDDIEDANVSYALDICRNHFHEVTGTCLQFFSFAVVMPAMEIDLGLIMKNEHLDIISKRQYVSQIGKCLQALHSHCEFVCHSSV